jgi:putative transposase
MLEQDIRTINEWKDVTVKKLNILPDHVHMVVSLPPKASISDYLGILKDKEE